VCSMVPVPDEADEDARRCVRERSELISERIGLTNRIGAILATLGVSDYNPLLRNRGRRLAELRTALGEPLPVNAHAKIKRLLARLELVLTQIAELERERDAVVETDASDGASKMIQQLTALRGIGVQSATMLVRQAFAAEAMDMPVDRVTVLLGDTDYPPTAGSGGSYGAATSGAAVLFACQKLKAGLYRPCVETGGPRARRAAEQRPGASAAGTARLLTPKASCMTRRSPSPSHDVGPMYCQTRWSRVGCRPRWAAPVRRTTWIRRISPRLGSPQVMTPRRRSRVITSIT
jgi:hypothetical protein